MSEYGLVWPGKLESLTKLAVGQTKEFVLDEDLSVQPKTSLNEVYFWDNLEVLKQLKKTLTSSVKLAYIDPPYNTGSKFVYNDNFVIPKKEYKKYYGTNLSGRFHSRWLSFMYPRLMLIHKLLREDGALFVSIDDNEVHNLRMLLDDVFGPENFVATIVWHRTSALKNSTKKLSVNHEYIVVYAKKKRSWTSELLERTKEMNDRASNPDNDPRGSWFRGDLSAPKPDETGVYTVIGPTGKKFDPPPGRTWGVSQETFHRLREENRIWWGKDGESPPVRKLFLDDLRPGCVSSTMWSYKDVGDTTEAKRELMRAVPISSTRDVFQTPKPLRLIQKILKIGTRPDESDIVLDCFAGTGTTGEAVLRLNAQDGGNRRFVLAQLPEPMKDSKSYKNITDVTLKRLEYAVAEVGGGFKVYR